jgi:hypothetical protein
MWTSRAITIRSALIVPLLASCSGGSDAVGGTVGIGPDPVVISTLPAPIAPDQPSPGPTLTVGEPSPTSEVAPVQPGAP